MGRLLQGKAARISERKRLEPCCRYGNNPPHHIQDSLLPDVYKCLYYCERELRTTQNWIDPLQTTNEVYRKLGTSRFIRGKFRKAVVVVVCCEINLKTSLVLVKWVHYIEGSLNIYEHDVIESEIFWKLEHPYYSVNKTGLKQWKLRARVQ